MEMKEEYERWMELALREAELAFEENEVPVGAVVVANGRVIGRGHNRTESLCDATAHAEMIALSAAYAYAGDWRLDGCVLVSTLEPCAMCSGAAVLSRVNTIVYGARDPKFGACGSIFEIPTDRKLNHRIEVVSGIMQDDVSDLMRKFFKKVRAEKEQIN
jgi:tRNA(adenine34) deaminase